MAGRAEQMCMNRFSHVLPRGHRGVPASRLGDRNPLCHNELTLLAWYGTARAPHYGMIHRFGSKSVWSFLRFAMPAVLGLILSAGVAEAQRPVPAKPQVPATRQSQQQIVPPGFFPPAGMCRIWINGVPAGQQPAPTDCASAVRNRPANGKVLFGDDPPKPKKGKNDKSKSSTTDELVDLITRRISK
jgi:hypothetical protein